MRGLFLYKIGSNIVHQAEAEQTLDNITTTVYIADKEVPEMQASIAIDKLGLSGCFDEGQHALVAAFLRNGGSPIVHVDTGGAPDLAETGVLTAIQLVRAGCSSVQLVPLSRGKVTNPVQWLRGLFDFYQRDNEIIKTDDNGRYILVTISTCTGEA